MNITKKTITKVRTTIYFKLVMKDSPGCSDIKNFKSEEEARQHYKTEYLERNKKDGYDERWRNTPYVIERVTTISEIIEM